MITIIEWNRLTTRLRRALEGLDNDQLHWLGTMHAARVYALHVDYHQECRECRQVLWCERGSCVLVRAEVEQEPA